MLKRSGVPVSTVNPSGVPPLENTERRTGVQSSGKPNDVLTQAESYWYFDAIFVRSVCVERIEIELMHAVLPSTYVGVRLWSDMNDIRTVDSRFARGQIDFAGVRAVRYKRVAF